MKSPSFIKDVVKTLSPLEQEVLQKMKEEKSYTAADLYKILTKKTSVAKSSVSVILDRLFKKGLLERKAQTAKGGVRFLYTLAANKEQYEKKIVDNAVHALIRKFGSNAIAYFHESLNNQEKRKP